MGKASGALRLLVVGAVVATGLGLAAAPAAAAPALTVTPATGLLDRSVVTVTGSGFAVGERLVVAQCAGATLAGCDLDPPVNTTAAYAVAGPDGTVSATLRLARVLELASGDVSCTAVACAVVAVTRTTPTERARAAVTFAATGTAPAPPDAALAVVPSDMRANGAATATLSGSGYLPWFAVVRPVSATLSGPPLDTEEAPISLADRTGDQPGAYVAVCPSPPSGPSGCARLVTSGTVPPLMVVVPLLDVAPVAPDGTVSLQHALPRMVETTIGRVDCAVADCSFALEQEGAPHSNLADVAWAPEWAPWPSADAFVSAVFPALLGRAATSSERSDVIAGLTDRSVTGFGLLRVLAGRADGLRLAELTRLYQAALGRRPDADGLLYWASELQRTGSMSSIAVAFGRSREFREAFGSVNDIEAVHQAYTRTLGRTPSLAEYGYWVGRLQAGLARTHMIHLFSRTPEYVAREAGRSELTAVVVALLHRAPTPTEWGSAGPGQGQATSRTADHWLLEALSSDELIAAVG